VVEGVEEESVWGRGSKSGGKDNGVEFFASGKRGVAGARAEERAEVGREGLESGEVDG